MDKKPEAVVGPDGVMRSPAEQHELNLIVASAFRGANGEKALRYLRSITTNMICGPEISADGLRHREGMRHLVAIIEARIKASQQPTKEKKNVPKRS